MFAVTPDMRQTTEEKYAFIKAVQRGDYKTVELIKQKLALQAEKDKRQREEDKKNGKVVVL